MISAKDYKEKQVKMVGSNFEDHEYTVVGPGHWRLRRKDSSVFWCDIVVMQVGLAVWGDIPGCFFSYYSGARKPEDLIYWIANSGFTSYTLEKANIGTGNIGIEEYIPEVAEYELSEALESAKEHFDEEWDDVKNQYTEAINDAIQQIRNNDLVPPALDSLYDDICDIEPDCFEWVFDIGKVPSMRYFLAVAAISRLASLLNEAL